MCDTLVAVGTATADGRSILAKNSDRQPNEAHTLVHFPRANHQPGSTLRCTYIDIPQVPETYEVLLSKPFWIWGCEMGANEHGVAIGNEAVFTKEPYEKGPGLIGMDLVRLALERASTARGALDVITQLLDAHGQGGNCGFAKPEYYHNAFAIADPGEAWVLETAGPYWAAERVKGVRTISNGLTIGREWDLASPGLVEHAIDKGWCRSKAGFHFAKCYSDTVYTTLSACRTRQQRSTALLEAQRGEIRVETMMAALRDHGMDDEADDDWRPDKGWLMSTLCVHAGFGPTRPSQSTGAMVAHLDGESSTYWVTGTSGTCTSLFKPVYLQGSGLPDLAPEPSGTFDAQSLWWSHERLHRAVIRDYASRMAAFRHERDDLEGQFLKEAAQVAARCQGEDPEVCTEIQAAFTARCFGQASEATGRWAQKVTSLPVQKRPTRPFSLAWDSFDRKAGFRYLEPGPAPG